MRPYCHDHVIQALKTQSRISLDPRKAHRPIVSRVGNWIPVAVSFRLCKCKLLGMAPGIVSICIRRAPLWRRAYSSTSRVPLAFDLHKPAKGCDPRKAPIIFMHGLFGSKKNNRSISKSAFSGPQVLKAPPNTWGQGTRKRLRSSRLCSGTSSSHSEPIDRLIYA
jgi:hypothetical protein